MFLNGSSHFEALVPLPKFIEIFLIKKAPQFPCMLHQDLQRTRGDVCIVFLGSLWLKFRRETVIFGEYFCEIFRPFESHVCPFHILIVRLLPASPNLGILRLSGLCRQYIYGTNITN